MKITIINGPNLNLLGTREPDVYGNKTFGTFLEHLIEIFPDVQFNYLQSNIEGELINAIQVGACQGMLRTARQRLFQNVSRFIALAVKQQSIAEVIK